MAKSDVNGDQTNEVYKWLKDRKAGLLGLTRIKVCALSSPAPPLPLYRCLCWACPGR